MKNLEPKAKPFSLTQSETARLRTDRVGGRVVAWQIDSIVCPITIAGNQEHVENPAAVLIPNGTVEDHSGGCTYESFEAWEVGARAEWTRDHAKVLAGRVATLTRSKGPPASVKTNG